MKGTGVKKKKKNARTRGREEWKRMKSEREEREGRVREDASSGRG